MEESKSPLSVSRRSWPRRLLSIVVLVVVAFVALFWFDRRAPMPPTSIFAGITYGCDRLEPSEQGSGLVHWVRVNLAAPGIELFVTPIDPTAHKEGWEYRLRRTA